MEIEGDLYIRTSDWTANQRADGGTMLFSGEGRSLLSRTYLNPGTGPGRQIRNETTEGAHVYSTEGAVNWRRARADRAFRSGVTSNEREAPRSSVASLS